MMNERYCKWKKDILPLLSVAIKELLKPIGEDIPLEEIRIRAGQPIQLCCGGYDRLIYSSDGRPTATMEDCAEILARVCEHSIYVWEDELKNGFVTMQGGYRVGICGRIVKEQGEIGRITDITSLNIRISRSCVGAADALIASLLRQDGLPYPTLIIAPPGCGKTTMLRDLARQLSYGLHGAHGGRVCVVDERMELSGSVRGVPQFDLGPRTDVLSGCHKPEGIRMAVRVLAPEVLITDELGGEEDAQAILEALYCGVATIASAHVRNMEGLTQRRTLMHLIDTGAFERIVLLGRRQGRVGEVMGVFDGGMNELPAAKGGILCFGCSP